MKSKSLEQVVLFYQIWKEYLQNVHHAKQNSGRRIYIKDFFLWILYQDL